MVLFVGLKTALFAAGSRTWSCIQAHRRSFPALLCIHPPTVVRMTLYPSFSMADAILSCSSFPGVNAFI